MKIEGKTMLKRYAGAALLSLMAATAARGQAAGFDVNGFAAPYVDGQTMAVAHLDASRIDTAALETYATALMDEIKMPAEARGGIPAAKIATDTFLARFKQLGGKHVILVLAQADIWPNTQPLAMVLKIEPGGDARGMADFLRQGLNVPAAEAVGDNLVLAGNPLAVQRLKTIKPQARPDLALTPSDAVAVAAISMTSDQRRVVREILPVLPQEVGGGSTEFLTRAPLAMNLQVVLPPKPSITLSYRALGAATGSQDEASAFIVRWRDIILANPEFSAAMTSQELQPFAGDLTAAIKDVLTPANGTLTIQDKHLRVLLHALVPSISMAQEQAGRVRSMSNIRQILMGVMIYAADHKDQVPESLDVLVKSGSLKPELLLNPNDAQHRPYVYRAIFPDTNVDASVPMVWEQSDGDGGLNVGFSDGHVEWVANRKVLDDAIKQAEAARAQRDAQKNGRGVPAQR